ncbi:PucR family transcriptional regulator [Pseudonocardia sp. H11422]|uniref:PucR family transcriptional regulator n=1 Tax=Pseudonocardia sp. H11422 TaxID=2835866 RepID=UPI001BDCCFD1|nr:helix-turn-helix domain-containing protein [Pseudonocardia sp. H11422]
MTDDELDMRRRRRALVDTLVAWTDSDSAIGRARELGHDLQQVHRVAAAQYGAGDADVVLSRAVELAAEARRMGHLLSRRAGAVILVARLLGETARPRLWTEVSRLLPTAVVAIGVGGPLSHPAEVRRSSREAFRALTIRLASATPNGVTVYDELGIEVVLAASTSNADADAFARHWLDPLPDHDAEHGTELLTTLSVYLDHDGDLARAAHELSVHRSTLRFRLQLVRELTDHDIRDPDTWQPLRVAVRVWQLLAASRWQEP